MRIHVDGGPENQREFLAECDDKSIRVSFSEPGRSKSNGKVERVFGALWHGLRCIMVDFYIVPSQTLPFIQCIAAALNGRSKADGRASSYEAFFRNVPHHVGRPRTESSAVWDGQSSKSTSYARI